MKVLNTNELEKINGGFDAAAILVITSAILFISGIFEGIVHPRSCG